MKNNKGITLVALIITIIVMLILVATTVAILIDSDLIGKADEATNAYKVRENGESTYGMNVNIDGNIYASVNDYVNSESGEGDDANPGSGEDDDVIVIDQTGTLILHAFGQKYKISNTTTWKVLDEKTDNITITTPDFVLLWHCKINETNPGSLQYLLANPLGDNIDTEGGQKWWQISQSPCLDGGEEETAIATSLSGDIWYNPGEWMGDEALDSVEEIKALEGFEANTIYIE